MTTVGFRAMFFAGAVLLAAAQGAVKAQAPAQSPSQGSVVPYDQMSAEAKKAQGAQAPAAAPAGSAAPANSDANAPVPAAAEDAKAETPTADGDAPKAADVPPAKDAKGKLVKAKKGKKEKPPKLIPVNIVKGELTVDGLIAKADLNFQIADLKYMYVWVPGLGTTVISNNPFPGGKLEVNALDGSTITVKVEDHQLQLACDHQLLEGKKPKPMSLYVALDPEFQKHSIYPEFGYGDDGKPPYHWPGSLVDASPNAKAPPLPENLRQSVQKVKRCTTNPDGTQNCTYTDVPLVLGKSSKS